jgi:hypothetical protein
MLLKKDNFWEDLSSGTQRAVVSLIKRLNYCRNPKVRAQSKILINSVYKLSETMRNIIDQNLVTGSVHDMSMLSRRSNIPSRNQRDSLKKQNSGNFEGEVFFKEKKEIQPLH